MKTIARDEKVIFSEISELVARPGYAHALAEICFRDQAIKIKGRLTASDISKNFDPSRTIRTEVNTLIGLMVQGDMDLSFPGRQVVEDFVTRTDDLLLALHDAMVQPEWSKMLSESPAPNPNAEFGMREPIFYSPESAYPFQYRDLAVEKHSPDNEWLLDKKGFSIEQGAKIAQAVCDLINQKTNAKFLAAKRSGSNVSTWLDVYEFSPEEVSALCGIDIAVVNAYLSSFGLAGRNAGFKTLGDFNEVVAFPFVPVGEGRYLSFQQYAIFESLYDSPFYWMVNDGGYKNTASDHRGEFTERFAAKCLSRVFGSSRVYMNVDIRKGKTVIGEVDVLVVFGDRILIVQAKSKKLSLEARKGNDGQLRKDFGAAIQHSYDQGWLCAQALKKGGYVLSDESGRTVMVPSVSKDIFIVNLISENYPALAFQARQYLSFNVDEIINAPYVLDVFTLDTLTEILNSPLQLIHYLRLRGSAVRKTISAHELNILGFHLNGNLIFDDAAALVMLDDSIASDIDAAMLVRREGIQGASTPPGILTEFRGTAFGRVFDQLDNRDDSTAIKIGLTMLEMGGQTRKGLSDGIDAITVLASKDGKRHDFTLGDEQRGITIHSNRLWDEDAERTLVVHCEKRKYRCKAPVWMGLSVAPDKTLQFGTVCESIWEQSDVMDQLTNGMKLIGSDQMPAKFLKMALKQKIGVNDPCSCGSGKKYKRCCRP